MNDEIKSPLTSIKGAAELLQDADMTLEQRQRFLGNIIRDSARMEELLVSMRDFSAADARALAGTSGVADVVATMDTDSARPKITISPPTRRCQCPARCWP